MKKPGKFQYEVRSTNDLCVALVTNRAFKAVASNDDLSSLDKEKELISMHDCPEKRLARYVFLPAGTYWCIMENKSDKPAEMTFHDW